MKAKHWIFGSAVVLCVGLFSAMQSTVMQPTATPDSPVQLGGNGKGKGPKCKHEVFCNPLQCEQASCQNNNPCQCECVPIPGCTPSTP